jgi:hypothetical protein
MHFFSNKHLIIAMFVAPLLSIIAYYVVDQFISEKPHVAVQGSSYKLIPKSNCRYKSGACTLENGDVEVKLRIEILGKDLSRISLNSTLPLQSVLVSLIDETEKRLVKPFSMSASVNQKNIWLTTIDYVPTSNSILRLVFSLADTLYYAETTTIFMEYETSFSRKKFSN